MTAGRRSERLHDLGEHAVGAAVAAAVFVLYAFKLLVGFAMLAAVILFWGAIFSMIAGVCRWIF